MAGLYPILYVTVSDPSRSQLLYPVHIHSLVQLSIFVRRPKIPLEQNMTCRKLVRHFKEERAAKCSDKTQIPLLLISKKGSSFVQQKEPARTGRKGEGWVSGTGMAVLLV